MSDVAIIERPRMSILEEKQFGDMYLKIGNAHRWMLLEMFERKAHITARFATFEDYCRGRLDIDHDKTYISHLLQAARVERAVVGDQSCDMSQLAEIKTSKMTIRLAGILAKAPEEKWKPLYDKYVSISGSSSYLPKEAVTELKRLVQATLPVPEPTEHKVLPAAPALPAAEPPKPRANMTPIVPPTYDRGPEYDDEPELETVEPDLDEPRSITNMAQEQRASMNLPSTDAAISLLRRYARDGHSDPLWCDVCAFLKGQPA